MDPDKDKEKDKEKIKDMEEKAKSREKFQDSLHTENLTLREIVMINKAEADDKFQLISICSRRQLRITLCTCT